MKQTFKLFAALALGVLVTAACSEGKLLESYITPDRSEISEIPAKDPAAVSLIVNTNTNWMVLDVPSWIQVEPVMGHGDAIITITPSANFKNENTETFDRMGSFRIAGNANDPGNRTGVSVTVTVKQRGYVPVVDPDAGIGGIPSLEEFLAFAQAVSTGGSCNRWLNQDGEVELQTDIDLSSVLDWTPIGIAKLGTSVKAAASSDNYFQGVFNGGHHSITGIRWTFDASTGDYNSYGLFGMASNATIKDLVLGEKGDYISIEGTPGAPLAAGALLAVGDAVTVKGVTNNVDVIFNGSNDPQFAMAGIVAKGDRCVIGGESDDEAVVNNGNIVAKSVITLTEAGEGGHMLGGIQGYMHWGSIVKAVNNGTISCGSGRSGGIVASINSGVTADEFSLVKGCVNRGTVRRDLYGNSAVTGNQKRMGGILGGAEGWYNKVEDCVNEGNVFAEYLCRCGGCVGHSKIQVIGFENKGIILSDKDSSHGPGWLGGYFDSVANAAKVGVLNIARCKMGGKVGSWTEYKDNPEGAPAATIDNVLGYNNKPGTQFNENEIIQ